MSTFLQALALKRYRGIGEDWQKMPDFKKFNFFIGPNNAGKSTVLNFISRHIPLQLGNDSNGYAHSVDNLEVFNGSRGKQIRMAVGVEKGPVAQSLINAMEDSNQAQGKVLVDKLLDALWPGELVWVGAKLPYRQKVELVFAPTTIPALSPLMQVNEWQLLWMILTRQQHGGLESHWIPETLERIKVAVPINFPPTRIIPAVRQIGKKDTQFGDYSGAGLIDRLMQVQSPDHDMREDRTIFDRINGFLQDVTGRPDARIEIPHNREHILVHMDERVLPLSSLGTGIEEVIMIAAFCTFSSKEIVCIEEPEIHLHPLLQRKLVRYLDRNTDNQYFIATHSASFIDTPGAAIFHVRLQNGSTTISEAVLRGERHAICMDLGHRASDIVQSNCVIWVEGPSDRIYLKHWIRAVDDQLVEGIHYSIMFYGGRLLNHLSANDEELDQFIALRQLNRNLAIIIDSDRTVAGQRLNDTKTRIRGEFEANGGIAWVTAGREIENYVDHTELQTAVANVYGAAYGKPLSGGRYDHALHFKRSAPKRTRKPSKAILTETNVDKVKVAHKVCEKEANLAVLDLRSRVRELVELIRTAND